MNMRSKYHVADVSNTCSLGPLAPLCHLYTTDVPTFQLGRSELKAARVPPPGFLPAIGAVRFASHIRPNLDQGTLVSRFCDFAILRSCDFSLYIRILHFVGERLLQQSRRVPANTPTEAALALRDSFTARNARVVRRNRFTAPGPAPYLIFCEGVLLFVEKLVELGLEFLRHLRHRALDYSLEGLLQPGVLGRHLRMHNEKTRRQQTGPQDGEGGGEKQTKHEAPESKQARTTHNR